MYETCILCTMGDYDNDGAMDQYVCNTCFDPGVNNLFCRNEYNNDNSRIKIKPKGTAPNASAAGTTIKVEANTGACSAWQMHTIRGPNGFIARFGPGEATIIDSIIVEWPSRHVTILTNVDMNQLMSIAEEYPAGYLMTKF